MHYLSHPRGGRRTVVMGDEVIGYVFGDYEISFRPQGTDKQDLTRHSYASPEEAAEVVVAAFLLKPLGATVIEDAT